MLKSFFTYYIKAFKLIKHNWIIFLFNLVIILGSKLNVIYTNTVNQTNTIGTGLFFVALPFNLVLIGFTFVPFLAFQEAVDKHKITISFLISGIKKLFLRTLPVIILLIILTVVWQAVIYFPQQPWMIFQLNIIVSLLVLFVSPLFSYFGIFFAVKNESISNSIKKSIIFSIQNMPFTFLVIFYTLIIWYLNFSRLVIPPSLNIFSLIYQVLTLYFDLLINAALFLYFTKNYRD
jgi:hypothetical protein